jgi:hypothetical protein
MIAPIRETDPPAQSRSQTPRDVRRLVASLFLDEDREAKPAAPPIPRWKAWLLVSWATIFTLIYCAAMLGLF